MQDAYQKVVGETVLPFYEGVLRGRGTFRYRAVADRAQWRSAEELRAEQWEKLGKLLDHAYSTTEYYRAAFDQAGLAPGDVRGPEDLIRLPVLEKATVRAERPQLISSAFPAGSLVRSATGGSTGEPMQFFYNRDSYERRCAIAMRGDGWAGWELCGPEFYIWGAAVLPQKGLARLKGKLYNAGLRRIVASSFELSETRAEEYVRQYNAQKPYVVVGYANALYEFAQYVRRAGARLHRPRGVISSAEKLFGYQRELIEQVFGAPVFDRYGCREVMLIGAECDRHEGLHVSIDNLYVEIVRDGRPCAPGESGDILLTDLHNYGMPLIRYRVGDVGSWKGLACSCGRGLPLLNVVEGRVLDVIRTPAGKTVPGEFFPHLLKDFHSVRTYQIIQERADELLIRICLDGPFPAEDRELLEQTIARMVGPEMRLRWDVGEDVVIERRAKFRPVLSRLGTASGADAPLSTVV